MSVSAEIQADGNTAESDAEEKQRGSGAFFSAEQHYQRTVIGLISHQRLEETVCKKSSEKIANGYCKKLQSISCGINSSLNLNRNFGAEDHVHISVHDRNEYPAENSSDAPDERSFSECKKKIFGTH